MSEVDEAVRATLEKVAREFDESDSNTRWWPYEVADAIREHAKKMATLSNGEQQ